MLATKRIEKQTEKQKVSKTRFFCATEKFVQEYGHESHCKEIGGTVFSTYGLARAEHNRLKAVLEGSADKDKPGITTPDWDSPEWMASYSKYSKEYGIELADFKFAEQWGVMDGIRLGCGARGDGYFLVLGKYFRAKGYEFLPLQLAYVFAQPNDILPSYCETDEAKKWVMLQSAILNLWDTQGIGFAITDQVIEEFEQLIASRYFGSKESKKKIKKEDTGRD